MCMCICVSGWLSIWMCVHIVCFFLNFTYLSLHQKYIRFMLYDCVNTCFHSRPQPQTHTLYISLSPSLPIFFLLPSSLFLSIICLPNISIIFTTLINRFSFFVFMHNNKKKGFLLRERRLRSLSFSILSTNKFRSVSERNLSFNCVLRITVFFCCCIGSFGRFKNCYDSERAVSGERKVESGKFSSLAV